MNNIERQLELCITNKR